MFHPRKPLTVPSGEGTISRRRLLLSLSAIPLGLTLGTGAPMLLAGRCWLPGSFDTLGGPILHAPKLQLVVVGRSWSTDGYQGATLVSIGAMLDSLRGGQFLRPLTQYRDRTGPFTNLVTVPDVILVPIDQHVTLTDAALMQLALANSTDSRQPETVWMFLTGPEVTTAIPQSEGAGYHRQIAVEGRWRTMCVVPFPDPQYADVTMDGSLPDVAYFTSAALSHEIVECITNPGANPEGVQDGIPSYADLLRTGYVDWTTGNEVGDVAFYGGARLIHIKNNYGLCWFYDKVRDAFFTFDGASTITKPRQATLQVNSQGRTFWERRAIGRDQAARGSAPHSQAPVVVT